MPSKSKRRSGNSSSKPRVRLLVTAVALLVCFSIAVFVSPYWTVYRMVSEATKGDGEAVAARVDFPSFRESLKAEFTALTLRNTDGGVVGRGITAIASVVADSIIDRFVTREALVSLLRGNRPTPNDRPQRAERDSDTELSYEAFRTFKIRFSDKARKNHFALIFTRHGLFVWKLSGIRLAD